MTVRRAAPVRYRWGDKLIVTVGWLLVVAAGCDCGCGDVSTGSWSRPRFR
jgi:hypothetical protein